MKFTKEHYNSLKSSIQEILSDGTQTIASIREKLTGKSETAILWAIYWASGWDTKYRDHYREGNYKDDHIETAVKSIVKELS